MTHERMVRVAHLGLDHSQSEDLIARVQRHPDAVLCGLFDTDPQRLERVGAQVGAAPEDRFEQIDACLERTKPDAVVVSSATAAHVELVEQAAAHGAHVLLHKPFASDVAAADRMIAAMEPTGRRLMVHWPLAYYPTHRTAKRLIAEGCIGHVREVHFYEGNRGGACPFVAMGPDGQALFPPELSKETGGVSTSYLGYGTTLATWFRDGEMPTSVTAVGYIPEGFEVETHSVVVASYADGLSTFQARWGTFTNPWDVQPQPRCGFQIVASDGTIASWDGDDHVRMQTWDRPEGEDVPVDELARTDADGVAHFLDCVMRDVPATGPASVETSRAAQAIFDAAMRSMATSSPCSVDRASIEVS